MLEWAAPADSKVYPPGATVRAGATVDASGRYRWSLTRKWIGRWAERGGTLTFVMLNPSKADGETDDPTVRRCVTFARREGYSGIRVLNLFAFRATDPHELRPLEHATAVGPQNDAYLREAFEELRRTERVPVAAWGANAPDWRVDEVLTFARETGIVFDCFGVTGKNVPRHPLFLPAITPLEPWEPR